ncbi:GH23862 [Drosophila grimshawi]|uniref:Cilia- and flagella-associated protein 91 n=1 Tax=Drosophila grimshawi TaxID=7222 RepID=B4K2X6_DROGR|nr:GH23862 [Drosophila grimshawi]
MRESLQSVKDYTTKCDYFPTYVDKRRYKDQTTQTLYRESSAQTVAYLPDIMDKEQDEQLELFNLATLLPGDKPPGLNEVEILERARKRWAFNQALKTSFRRQLHEAREKAIKSKYRPILEAFEWEHWMEREEYIQECQMMRLEIVIRMFDKREKEMHAESKTRIEVACEGIEQKRQRGLAKNEVEYQRAMRRLQIKNAGLSRHWVKQSPMYALGSPCSEFYGPLIRHGVDPARRSFVGDGRKAFDMRIDDLEKRVDMDKLQCPFTKLKEWSKPKEYVKEYEQNFCSDKHLQKLYESLKTLRSQATKQKTTPKCLKRRPKPPSEDAERPSFNFEDTPNIHDYFQDRRKLSSLQSKNRDSVYKQQKLAIEQSREMLRERRNEDLEQLLHMYEGSTIGWIMQFLSEEMERLQEQRKLHFFAILTQKERWRREAAEAGLRQKENDMRLVYEEMFQRCNVVHTETARAYIDTILTTDMAHIAECDAAETVTLMARQIDADIRRWLESFKLIQTPLTYESLRNMLHNMVVPDLNVMLVKYEKALTVKYIIEDVLFPQVWESLDSYDIASVITSDMIDRLTDNDLLLFSTESEGEEPPQREAEAIIRKLIRQAVPGRRWKTATERIVHENCVTLFDDIFAQVMERMNEESSDEPVDLHLACSRARISPTDKIRDIESELLRVRERDTLGDGDYDTTYERTQILSLLKKMKIDNITKDLTTDEVYDDTGTKEIIGGSQFLNLTVFNQASEQQMYNDQVFGIISTADIGKEEDFSTLHSKPREPSGSSSPLSIIGIDFGERETQTRQEDQLIGALSDIISYASDEEGIIVEEENTEYEADDERSWWNMQVEDDEEMKQEAKQEKDAVSRLTLIDENDEMLLQNASRKTLNFQSKLDTEKLSGMISDYELQPITEDINESNLNKQPSRLQSKRE